MTTETTTRGRKIYQPTEKVLALPTVHEMPSDESIKIVASTGQSKRNWGLVKREYALKALRGTRDYNIGIWQGRVDAARGTGYSEERMASDYNLGYHVGFAEYESNRKGWQTWQREQFDALYLAD